MISPKTNGLRLIMLPFRDPLPNYKDLYEKTAACWQEVWLKVNENFELPGPLFTDNLTRQDEGAVIFQGERCAGMILFRILDFSVMNYRSDSYFKEWTDDDLKILFAHGNRAFLAAFLTVHPEFRNFSPKVKFKEVLLDIMVRRFQESNASVIAGITRRDRDINNVSFDLGALPIRENVAYFGGREKVDLVGFYRHAVKLSANPEVHKLTSRLWDERLELSQPEIRRLNAA